MLKKDKIVGITFSDTETTLLQRQQPTTCDITYILLETIWLQTTMRF